MRIPFYKYQATGNDFVIINQLMVPYLKEPAAELVSQLCDRRFGIGADGLMLLEEDEDHDFKMVYYNSDGRLSSMCGNGGRCIVDLAHSLKLIGSECSFIAPDGPHMAYVRSDDMVELQMSKVDGIRQDDHGYFINTGSPHLVIFDEAWDRPSINDMASKLRYHEDYAPNGVNVNYIQRLSDSKLAVRTYERGVEDETYSCGTGVTAAALVAHSYSDAFRTKNSIDILTRGGNLNVRFKGNMGLGYSEIYLTGPAKKVYEGFIDLGEIE